MTGSVSLTIMFARRSVTRSRCPFLRIGLILFAYSFCFLRTKAQTLVNEPYHVNYKDSASRLDRRVDVSSISSSYSFAAIGSIPQTQPWDRQLQNRNRRIDHVTNRMTLTAYH